MKDKNDKKDTKSDKNVNNQYILYLLVALSRLKDNSTKSVKIDMSNFKLPFDKNSEHPRFVKEIIKPLNRLGYQAISIYEDGKPYLIIQNKKESKNDWYSIRQTIQNLY